MTAVDTGLAGEYAAIYAYGSAAVHLSGAARDLAEALEAEHRDRRDALLDFYGAHGLESTPAPASYDIDPIEDAESAQALLLDIEMRLTTAWRAGVASEDHSEREICLNMLLESSKAVARWRVAVGESFADPWPGRPE
ncbi:ferritin-like domain-containing protein [Glycomyces sp. L485]|uniref:ferritin-like domain-containing protein n=1 Tax=Glycomyces sp. L485 TaxID=2909235 RepID=UPI001F4A0E8C|nr:ferritin-like domain-containing protein [Glycomyces sp. L485]MCH7230486.1 ferritin-like domain-containing protein [Glycomyces sp. L485]